MRSTMKFQFLTHGKSAELAERLPYRAPICRALTFRAEDPLCESGDFMYDGEGDSLNTDNTGEGTGSDYYGGGN